MTDSPDDSDKNNVGSAKGSSFPAASTPASAVNTEVVTEGETLRQDGLAMDKSLALSRLSSTAPGIAPGYEIIRSLGEGSFGSVWLATESRTGRQVAIKFYTHRQGLDWSLLSREVEKLAVLYTSRNIVGLLDVGWDRDPPYFVMEYLEQGPLSRRLASGPLPPVDAVRIAREMLSALIHAHNSGILHCDVKPANVLIDSGGTARLGDFGQSRLTTEQSPSLGTLYYMAPEQAVLDAVPDARWDVYAFGALLYHMLTGSPPYRTRENDQALNGARTLEERLSTYRKILAQQEKPDLHRRQKGVDRRLAELVDACLERDPALRLPNAQVALDLLQKRDQAISKRPLIALGIIGPLLFIATLIAVASQAVPKAERTAEVNLVERALMTDVSTAAILAASVQQEFDVRLKELEDVADQLVAQDGGGKQLREGYTEFLDQWYRTATQRLERQGRTVDDSIFVTSADGEQIYRTPRNETIGQNFAHRDYFHGLGRELNPTPGMNAAPRQTGGISLAYRSRSSRNYKVSVAVPIWNRPRTQVLGVLARSINLRDLLNQWEKSIGKLSPDSADRFLALADLRESPAYLLDHPWLSRQEAEQLEDQALKERLQLNDQQRKTIEKLIPSSRYDDPISRLDNTYAGEWLAAFAPVGQTGWYAIVQERRSNAVQPVQNLREVFVQYGIGAVLAMLVVFGLLGTLLFRASR